MSDIITRDENGNLAMRTVTATEDTNTSQYDDLYTRTTDGKRALRVVGAGGGSGSGDVSSVNGQKGDVVLTGADINATLTNGDVESTSTINEHLQTLKNDLDDLGDQVSVIESKMPENASQKNPLVTKEELGAAGTLPEQTGKAGQFLTTDGETTEWANPLQNNPDNYLSPGYFIGNVKPGKDNTWNSLVASAGTTLNQMVTVSSQGSIIYGQQSDFKQDYATIFGNFTGVKVTSFYGFGKGLFPYGASVLPQTFYVGFDSSKEPYALLNKDGTIPSERLTTVPETDGTYILKCIVTDGVAAMQWVAE